MAVPLPLWVTVPVFDHPHSGGLFPIHLARTSLVAACVHLNLVLSLCTFGEEFCSIFSTPSFKIVEGGSKISTQPFLLYAEQTQFHPPLFIFHVLHLPKHTDGANRLTPVCQQLSC